MNCHEARRSIWGYIDHEVDPRVHRRITAHLDECDACLARFRGEEALELGFTRSLLAAAPTPKLWDRIEAALDAADSQVVERVRPRRRPWIPLAAAAAILVGTLLAIRVGFQPPVTPVPIASEFFPEVAKIHWRVESGALAPTIVEKRWTEIDKWAKDQPLKFSFELKSGHVEGLELVGAATATVRGEQALVVFTREATPEHRPVHLVVLSSRSVEKFPQTRFDLEGKSVREKEVDSLRVAALLTDQFLVAGIAPIDVPAVAPFVEALFKILEGEASGSTGNGSSKAGN